MEGRPTIRDVADRAGVSFSTVSKAINGSPLIHPNTRARVLAAARDVGYQRNVSARALRRQRTETIGLIAGRAVSSHFARVFDAFQAAAARTNHHITIVDPRPVENAPFPVELGAFDGLIVRVFNDAAVHEHVVRLQLRGFPVVYNHWLPTLPGDRVYSDRATGVRLALEHLRSLGHCRAAAIGYDRGGFSEEARKLGLEPEVYQQAEDGSSELMALERGYHLTRSMLAAGSPATALIGTNDEVAIGAMAALRESGLEVPENISVVGFDDFPVGRFSFPRLTTVQQNYDEEAEKAMELLIERIKGYSGPPREVIFQPTLIVRESTGRVPSTVQKRSEVTTKST